MSSWLPSFAGRLLLAGLALAIGCQPAPREHERRPNPAAAPAALPTPPLPSRPWFQGTWARPPSTELEIDQAGLVSGHLKGDLGVRGLVDEETVRLEADGPSGHGVAVLRRESDRLRGFLTYAAPGASEGVREELELERTEPR
jgi:hypothetical protein